MKLVVGLVLFLVGINVGFVTAGLMHAGATQLVHTPKELEKLLLGESDNLEHKNKR